MPVWSLSDKQPAILRAGRFCKPRWGRWRLNRPCPHWGEAAENSNNPQPRETSLFALPQFLRPDPFSDIVRADRDAAAAASGFQKGHRLSLECPVADTPRFT